MKTNYKLGNKKTGKVRDIYDIGDKLIFITTDRLSAFDRVITQIPFKGQILNQTSLWWFNQTKRIIDNSLIESLHPNVTVMKKMDVVPIEFIVRGYMTGSTETSLWTHYKKNGDRMYCGNELEDNMVKNQKLPTDIITPTTKGDVDELTSAESIIKIKYTDSRRMGIFVKCLAKIVRPG